MRNFHSGQKHLQQKLITIYTESTAPTCCRAKYFSLRSFWKTEQTKRLCTRTSHKKFSPLYVHAQIRCNVGSIVTHSSITRPSPTSRGPESTGGFLRTSSAASASANCLFSFSRACKPECHYWKSSIYKMDAQISLNKSDSTYRTRVLCIQKYNPQNSLNSHLILLFIKLYEKRASWKN